MQQADKFTGNVAVIPHQHKPAEAIGAVTNKKACFT
jgi:hypothetical protein